MQAQATEVVEQARRQAEVELGVNHPFDGGMAAIFKTKNLSQLSLTKLIQEEPYAGKPLVRAFGRERGGTRRSTRNVRIII